MTLSRPAGWLWDVLFPYGFSYLRLCWSWNRCWPVLFPEYIASRKNTSFVTKTYIILLIRGPLIQQSPINRRKLYYQELWQHYLILAIKMCLHIFSEQKKFSDEVVFSGSVFFKFLRYSTFLPEKRHDRSKIFRNPFCLKNVMIYQKYLLRVKIPKLSPILVHLFYNKFSIDVIIAPRNGTELSRSEWLDICI